MPEARIIPFYDFHQAHLAAHQLQHEGICAEVFDYTLSTASWPGFGFRILAIPPCRDEEELEEEETELDLLEPGVFGNAIDSVLRFLSVAAVCALPFLTIVILLNLAGIYGDEPLVSVQLIAEIALFLLVVSTGALVSVPIYQGYRRGNSLCLGIFRVTAALLAVFKGGWLVLLPLFLVYVAKSVRAPRDNDP